MSLIPKCLNCPSLYVGDPWWTERPWPHKTYIQTSRCKITTVVSAEKEKHAETTMTHSDIKGVSVLLLYFLNVGTVKQQFSFFSIALTKAQSNMLSFLLWLTLQRFYFYAGRVEQSPGGRRAGEAFYRLSRWEYQNCNYWWESQLLNGMLFLCEKHNFYS